MNFILGSSGQARESEWILRASGQAKPDHFVGRDFVGSQIHGIEVISEERFKELITHGNHKVWIGIGNPKLRAKLGQEISKFSGVEFPNAIHPSAFYDYEYCQFGHGLLLAPGVIVTTDVSIGNHVHLNVKSYVGHESVIGDFTTISPAVHIAGNVKIGKRVFMGIGACTVERISICDDAVIGAGAVITKSIVEPGTYVGAPAKRIS